MDSSDFAAGFIVGLLVAMPLVWLLGQPRGAMSSLPLAMPVASNKALVGQKNEEVQTIERDSEGFIKRIVIHREVKNL